MLRAFILAVRSWIAVLTGAWTEARADLDRAASVSSQTDRSWYTTYLPIFQARLSLVEGALKATSGAVQEALAQAGVSGDLQALRWAATTMAELEILEGHPAAARARLVPLLDRPGLQECDVTTLLPVLAGAHLELGQPDEAADTVEQTLRRARPEGMRLVLVDALRVRALVALRRERWEEAADSLEEGLALARAMPYPYAEARLLQLYGQLYAQQGDLGTARACLEAAWAIFARLGARQDRMQVEQALAALPRQPAPFQNSPSSHNGLRGFRDTRLTDAQWAAIAPLLPRPSGTGRPRADDRQTIEAILYKLETGCAWSALPAALGDGVTAHRRLRAWEAAGVWPQIAAIVQAEQGGQPAP